MIYMTHWFLVFAILAIGLVSIVPSGKPKLFSLLLVSAIFHTYFAGPAGVIPIIFIGVASYLAGLTRNRQWIRVAIAINIGSLIYYKYTKFLIVSFLLPLFPGLELLNHPSHWWSEIYPPLAISFFTFEYIHYLIDVQRGSPTIYSKLDFALFSIFWPSIVAGPVKRYQIFIEELRKFGHSRINSNDFVFGIARIFSGYIKKILADNITAAIRDYDTHFLSLPYGQKWLLIAALALRIYWDFSGYSDIAIGMARLLGIRLPENFNWPYLASSAADFWRRWHISLSTWIRDYIYIPLGGNRSGPLRKGINGITAFFLCGLWHGADWNFAIWGIYHGIGVTISTTYRTWGFPMKNLGYFLDRFKILSHFATLLFILIGWIFFFYPAKTAILWIGALAGM